MADNRDHYLWFGWQVGESLETQTRRAANLRLDPTRIDVHYAGSLTSLTDVWFKADRYNGTSICGSQWSGLYAWTICMSLNSADECEQHEIRYNKDNLDGTGDGWKEHVACHELGHSLGLKHRQTSDSCMYPDEDAPVSVYYDQHDKDMFYNFY